ncbi:MAG: hypothetical protein ACHQLQ_09435 [Candidatus Acidiferrales bacterium]
MRERPARPQNFYLTLSRSGARISLLVLCSAEVISTGCGAVRRKPSFGWGTAVQARPKLPTSRTSGGETPVDLGPELQLVILPPPSAIAAARGVPARPRGATGSSAENNGSGKPEAPIIVPELTAEETTAAKQQTGQSLGVAERNLAATRGKNLNAAQIDLASKVRSFISEARDAAGVSDWIRARDLAKKAQVLSEELAKSL